MNVFAQEVVLVSGLGLLILSFILPLLFINLKKRVIRIISLTFSLFGFSLLLYLSSIILYFKQLLTISLSYLPFSLFLDRLAAFFILVIALISFTVAIYSFSYIEHYSSTQKKNILTSLMSGFVLCMILVILAKDMFSFLVFWELIALTSFLLVMFEYEKKETLKAGLFYFIMTHLSTMFLFGGFILLYLSTGTWNLVPASTLSSTTAGIIFVILFIGFAIKAGVIPFHKWLPYAHPASPSNISALMSGVMIKVAIYGLMRFTMNILPARLWWGIIILIFGTISAFLGVIYALKEHDIKRLLAYHSIENIGIILIGFGLYQIFHIYQFENLAILSLLGTLFHVLNHALFKCLLFLTAGSVVQATGTRNIEEMGGLIKVMPYTGILFLIGSISISALPPFNGFVSELMIFQALFQSSVIHNPLVVMILVVALSLLALTSALAAACFVKAFAITFLAAPRSEAAAKAKEVHLSMLIGPGILAILCILLGVFSYQLFAFFGYILPIPNMLYISIALLINVIIILLILFVVSPLKIRVSETWGCGLLSQNAKMEYTASGFSEPILTIFSPIYHPKKHIERVYAENSQSIFKHGTSEIELMNFFEKYIYMPIISFIEMISRTISKMYTGNLDTYIAYVFMAIMVLIIIIGWWA